MALTSSSKRIEICSAWSFQPIENELDFFKYGIEGLYCRGVETYLHGNRLHEESGQLQHGIQLPLRCSSSNAEAIEESSADFGGGARGVYAHAVRSIKYNCKALEEPAKAGVVEQKWIDHRRVAADPR
jgi:hypothetical protein